jgi:hypothetical protein
MIFDAMADASLLLAKYNSFCEGVRPSDLAQNQHKMCSLCACELCPRLCHLS